MLQDKRYLQESCKILQDNRWSSSGAPLKTGHNSLSWLNIFASVCSSWSIWAPFKAWRLKNSRNCQSYKMLWCHRKAGWFWLASGRWRSGGSCDSCIEKSCMNSPPLKDFASYPSPRIWELWSKKITNFQTLFTANLLYINSMQEYDLGKPFYQMDYINEVIFFRSRNLDALICGTWYTTITRDDCIKLTV